MPTTALQKTVAKVAIASANLALSTCKQGRDSAALCLTDAQSLFDQCDFKAANRRAVHSLGYSVGIAAPSYKRCYAAFESLYHQRA